MEEEEDQAMRKELKPTKKQKDLEEIARRYLHRTGRNVSWGKGKRGRGQSEKLGMKAREGGEGGRIWGGGRKKRS